MAFFQKGKPMLLVKKMSNFSLFRFGQSNTRKMLNNFWREKRKKFSQSQKSHFSKRVNHAFGQKMPIFSLFVFA